MFPNNWGKIYINVNIFILLVFSLQVAMVPPKLLFRASSTGNFYLFILSAGCHGTTKATISCFQYRELLSLYSSSLLIHQLVSNGVCCHRVSNDWFNYNICMYLMSCTNILKVRIVNKVIVVTPQYTHHTIEYTSYYTYPTYIRLCSFNILSADAIRLTVWWPPCCSAFYTFDVKLSVIAECSSHFWT